MLAAALATLCAGAIGIQAAVGQPEKTPQMAEVPAPADRYAIWAKDHAGESIQASVQLSSVTADARVVAMLRQSGAIPYVVNMFLDNRYGAHRTAPERASLDLIVQARADSVTMQEERGKGLQKRAQELKTKGWEGREGIANALPELAEQRRNALAGLRGGSPMIYGLAVTGTEAQLKALAEMPGVAKVEPGVPLASGRVAVGTPNAPEQRGNATKKMNDAEVKAEIDRLAAGQLGE